MNTVEQIAPVTNKVVYEKKIDKLSRAYGTGRRKNSTARVWVKLGTGAVTVNGRKFEGYFARSVLRMVINQPFAAISMENKFDVVCTTKGGGLTGQAGAIRLGISRALIAFEPLYQPKLRKLGFLTRDSRVVERKKYGLRKARKATQFSKR
ncbi:MAG: 30S ribosomal protein S9 [Pseudomonadota bacterium]